MTKRRKAVLTACLLALALPPAAAAFQEKSFNQTVSLESGGRLSLKAYKGSIRISAWDQEQIEIVARIVPGDGVSGGYAEESVEATRVRVRGSGRSVDVESDYEDVPCQDGWSFFGIRAGCSKVLPYVHYTIRAPRRLSLRLKDYKSEISLQNLEGDLEMETYKGVLEATGLTGEIQIETYKGRGRIDSLNGSFEIETYKGDIQVEVAEITDRSRIQTYKGTVTLGLPASQRLSLRADLGRRADFDSDFSLTMNAWSNDSLRGEINGGGPELSIESYKGEIHLRRR